MSGSAQGWALKWSESEDVVARIGALWGKERGGFALLAEHLLDTAAVGEIMWDSYLAPAVRSMLERASGGNGKSFFAWLCGIHDVGKAAPSFQCKVDELATKVQEAGLSWRSLSSLGAKTHHTIAGARILKDLLPRAGWSRPTVGWVWPLIAGHHGRFADLSEINAASLGAITPDRRWAEVQLALLGALARATGAECLLRLQPDQRPTRGEQLALSGLIVMADWIASGDECRGGATDLSEVTMTAARARAAATWSTLQLRGGWRSTAVLPDDLMKARFGRRPRPAQQVMSDVCNAIPAPGIIIVEAGMGEGKTELSLVGTEILSHRFGLDGLFDGMPTQATSDQMFERVYEWSQSLADPVPVALSHGRRRFNKLWRELATKSRPSGVDEYGQDDPYGCAGSETEGLVVEWLMGRHRPLLTPVCIGTVDNQLHTATRTRYVALRFAGMAGKVVVLDEIHAYSLYMQQFLHESLRWLGSVGAPVVLLTATLPPTVKEQVIGAYLEGRSGKPLDSNWQIPSATGYPVITWATTSDGSPVGDRISCSSGLPERRVELEVLPDVAHRKPAPLGDLLTEALADGGRVLIVRNTVGRAQETYLELAERFGDDVALLHSRFTAADRSELTQTELDSLGPAADTAVGNRHILVATQVAEQSFDIDVDLLITDLAPIDLLLQRMGRMHRRAERDPARPARLGTPRAIITGMTLAEDAAPEFPFGVEKIYSPYLLLRTAAVVLAAAQGEGWHLPSDVPKLVSLVYSDEPVTDQWQVEMQGAKAQDQNDEVRRRAEAEPFLLTSIENRWDETLAGLHVRKTADLPDDDAVAAVVRDGPETVEVLLVREDDGDLLTLGGRRLTRTGAMVADDDDAVEEAVGSTIRLPFRFTDAARNELRPSSAFGGDGYLRNVPVLPLDEENGRVLGNRYLHYDPRLGLVDEPAGGRGE